MRKGMQKYVKYTADELEQYIKTDGSCVKKVNTELKINVFPNGLRNFKKSLLELLPTERVGSYDHHLQGIILDIRNIKLLGSSFAIRFDDPRVHVRIQGDCYVFQPAIGAVVRGTVRHVSSSQIGVIIYRVFSVSVRLLKKASNPIEVDSEILLKVKKFDLENIVPFIEGELLEQTSKVKKADSDDEASSPDQNDIEKLLTKIKKEDSEDSTPVKRIKLGSDDDSDSD